MSSTLVRRILVPLVLATMQGVSAGAPLGGDLLAQEAYLKASNTTLGDGFAGDFFGNAVAVDGDLAVVGAPNEKSSATGVDGDQANNDFTSAGAAYVFVRNGTTWSQEAYLKASNTNAFDAFGTVVAISGNTIVIGAQGEASSATGIDGNQLDNSSPIAGAAYVFVRTGTTWSQEAYLKASNTDPGDLFGISVAISGDTIVVGARGESSASSGVGGDESDNGKADAGAAYVFVRNGTTWTQEAYLKASNPDAGDWFGLSVSIDQDTLIVSAEREASNATGVDGDQSNNSGFNVGAAYAFVRSGATWTQEAYLKAGNSGSGDQFGRQVALSGDLAVVSAVFEDSASVGVDGDPLDNSASNSGAAYVFARSGARWTQEAYLKASDVDPMDEFGFSVAIDEETVLVGAWNEDGGATGVNGSVDESAPNAGAVFQFVRSGTTWSECAYIKASNTDQLDNFGASVALSQQTVLVGATGEDSRATGVDGDQSDGGGFSSGASYVFDAITPSMEVSRPGTPPNPDALLPGQTSGPITGSTWDPVIDHTVFATTAVTDFLIVTQPSSPPVNIATGSGTLLCDPGLTVTFATEGPGSAFAIPVPSDSSLVGIALCSQGASREPPGIFSLTNALDLTIGGF